ncbi:MAG: ribonuclease J [Synergistaceae bacterium]|nr:ribonuclease J [Synergistaceae bacterium]
MGGDALAKSKPRRRRSGKSSAGADGLRVIPLGGLGQIGKNCTLFEYGEDLVMVDCGLMFPEEDMLGIDFVIPDVSYVEERKDRLRGIVVTHGHEDHIGALSFVLPRLDVPVYATKLTLGLIRNKLKEAAPTYEPRFHEIRAGDVVELGAFSFEFIAVCHSIPDGVGLAIHTPLGTIVHTGDFKLDPTPIDGRITDYSTFAELGRRGVLLMMSDSTNVERSGFTHSERLVGRTLEEIFRLHRNKRIVLATFASNLHRAQQVFDTASRFNRKVVLMGRSMVNNVELARELGYLDVEDSLIVTPQEVDRIPHNRLVVLTTGSQGEPFSGLVLMSKGEHHHIKLSEKDLVVVSATPIPGNEKLVSRTVNRLFACGCDVVYEREKEIHVSGHAAQEELKMLLAIVRPRYFVPVHGEYRHLVRHSQLAQDMGLPAKNVFLLQNGDVLQISKEKAQIKGNVSVGSILVDGRVLGELEGSVMQERRDLSEEGLLAISVVLSPQGALAGPVGTESRGFLHADMAEDLHRQVRDAVAKLVETSARKGDLDTEALTQRIKGRVRDLLRRQTRSYPLIMPMVSVVKE